MTLGGFCSMQEAIDEINAAEDKRSFESAKFAAQEYLKQLGFGPETIKELEREAFFFENEYSEKDTQDRLEEAKDRVIKFLCRLMDRGKNDDPLMKILENYYLFLENLLERMPDKRGGIQKEQLDGIKIKNEYDVQHLLYAYLKPLYPLARAEVSEDTGYGTVRADILLDSDRVIEVKCSRDSMTIKKLTEEIGTDIVHYSASELYFFIYDREKIIKDPANFKKTYESIIKEKKIQIVIHQPKKL